MATLYITEFTSLKKDFNFHIPQAAVMPANAEQTVAIGAGSVQSAAFSNGTKIVRLESDAICSVTFGPNPTATAGKMRMAADSPEYFMVNAGDKVAVISNT